MTAAVEQLSFPDGYTRIRGRDIPGPTKKAISHFHLVGRGDDGLVRFEAMAEYAAANELNLVPSPHNNRWGSEALSREVVRQGYDIEVEEGFEYAAIPKQGEEGKAKHVLVLGVDSIPNPGLTEEEINRWAHRRNGFTIAAHPGLTVISTSLSTIERLNSNPEDPEARYDAVEDYNPAVDLTYRKVRQMDAHPVGECIVDLLQLPRHDLNTATQAFMAEKAADLGLVPFAGSDGHSLKTAGDVIWEYPAHLTPLEALRAGETIVYKRDVLTEVTPKEYAMMRISDTFGIAWQYIDERFSGDIMRSYGSK